jgi:isocitrate dehydrogenase kinase/phosphatase
MNDPVPPVPPVPGSFSPSRGTSSPGVDPEPSSGAAHAARAATIIADAFAVYVALFRVLTCVARDHFERRDWHAMQHDSMRRLDLYTRQVDEGLAALRVLLGEMLEDRPFWATLRAAYERRIAGDPDDELAETFFNSITRRIFHTIGVDPAVEFVVPASPYVRAFGGPWSMTQTFERRGNHAALYREVLERYRFAVDWADPDADAARIAAAVEEQLGGEASGLELARPVFYRNTAACIVGKLHTPAGESPFLLALAHPAGGIVVDAVLLTADEVSIVFSFARSYFLVEMDSPREMVEFLRSIMPKKPIAELFIAVGCNKHGKTELYRSLLNHLRKSDERFEIAPGQRGMVMCVFTLPGFDVVFKVLRDHFVAPKTVTHAEVLEKYRLVFRHDRAGRLVDAQEFEHLAFERRRFSDALLAELAASCREAVRVDGDRVVIRHLFTERRLRPLDLYLREALPEAAREAVVDYGQVLRDLAATNIFPGDMLLKNFGVSRHGRLIFYDYDELCRLTDCNFRTLPAARGPDEELAQEPWFFVGDRDIFPEEFRAFLGLKGDLLDTFLEAHGELLEAAFWCRMQDRHRGGEVLDIFPYKESRRLRRPRPDHGP